MGNKERQGKWGVSLSNKNIILKLSQIFLGLSQCASCHDQKIFHGVVDFSTGRNSTRYFLVEGQIRKGK